MATNKNVMEGKKESFLTTKRSFAQGRRGWTMGEKKHMLANQREGKFNGGGKAFTRGEKENVHENPRGGEEGGLMMNSLKKH